MEYLQESTNLLSTPDYFKQWLNTKQSTEIIGERGTCINCSLANFLKKVCHWVGSFSSTIPYQKACLYVDPS